MKIVMTLMVRDEGDIIAAMIEHHLAQGVDHIICTDNGSVDGTREILARYADEGVLELHDDLRHEKQQSEVVTQMARSAFTDHGADWVLNADADEFWLPVDRSLTLREAFSRIPTTLGAFDVPVVNLTGTPARKGTGISRLTWRDNRGDAELMDLAGLHAQPTANAVHRGSADVVVAQGNHFVSIESLGQPDDSVMIEVLHLPWRSFAQHRAKVEMSGRAYDANPNLRPSPNHHGMRDYRRLLAGYVEEFYLYRHPVDPAHDPDFEADTVLVDELGKLAAGGAVLPDLVSAALDPSGDAPYSPDEIAASAQVARTIIPLERIQVAVAERAREDYRRAVADRKEIEKRATRQRKRLEQKLAETTSELERLRASRSYRVGAGLLWPARRLRRSRS
jgi:hypothetical protein